MPTPCRFAHESGRAIACGDAEIYVEEAGNPRGPALILLPGGFGTIEDFNPILPVLGRHFRLIGIDSRGHGKSTLGAAKLTYQALADDLASVIDALGLREFHVLGFSDGGIAAYRFAATHPAGLRQLVTVGASWEMSDQDPAWGVISGMTGEAWKEMLPHSVEAYLRLNPQPDYERFAAAVVAMWTDLSSSGHPEQLARDIAAPTLVVRGDHDFLTNLESMARLKKLNENVSFLNVPQAEHVVFEESPDVFLAAIGRFLGTPLR